MYWRPDFAGDPLASLLPDRRPLSIDSSSDGCFDFAHKWLQTCLKNHDKCPKQLSPLPSRVIDVGRQGSDSREPFLHISQGESGSWLALSHCWGSEQTFTTTSGNLESFSQRIQMNALPETFKDAIMITRRLGYQYVWIDSLCIMQDSLEDWEVESKNMAMIYKNATATISADAAHGDHEGIFKGVESQRDRFKLVALPCHSAKRDLKGNILITILQKRNDWNLQIMPLQTRAWVLQEKALSVRSLHYEATDLFWHCQTVTSIETRPNLSSIENRLAIGELHKIPRKAFPPQINFTVDLLNRVDQATDQDALTWWYTQVSDYATRQLTFKRDRFPAIAGLAKEFAERTGYHYMAGIWAEDFQAGLLWKGSVPESYAGTAPSWSWVGAEFSPTSGIFYNRSFFKKHGSDFAAELVSFTEPKDVDVYLGGGAATILTLRGWCQDIREFISEKKFYGPPFSPNFLATPQIGVHHQHSGSSLLSLRSSPPSINSPDEETVLLWADKHFTIETASSVLVEKQAIVLRISEYSMWDAGNARIFNVWGLLLKPTGMSNDTYQRIGLIKIPSKNPTASIEGFDLRTIRIA